MEVGPNPVNANREIRIGTSGFSYDDWVGNVYPVGLPQNKWFEYYTTLFDCLEINYTYYRMPSYQTMVSLCKRAPRGFAFVIKGHQSFTHGFDRSGIPEYLRSVSVIREQGFPLLILLQFPNSFRRTDANRTYLDHVIKDINIDCAVEFRHESWDRPQVIDTFRERGILWVSVDQPALQGLMNRRLVDTDGYYLRFHGRNAEKWYAHEHAYERYDYQYSEEELMEWVGKIRLVEKGRKLVFFNNHFRGKAVINATMLKSMIGTEKIDQADTEKEGSHET